MPIVASNVTAAAASASRSQQRSRRHRQANPPSPAASSSSSSSRAAAASTAASTIQTIYDVSRDVFAAAAPGFQPPPRDVARLSGFLDGLKLQDVGLDASMPYLRSDPDDEGRRRPTVTYLHFADSPKLSFGVFCLPESAVIPLHDHPGMTVFSKVLLGSMHIKAYDWVKAPPPPPPTGIQAATRTSSNGARLAKLVTDAVLDASSETVVLYPESGGNLHCFTATAPCVVLDVMGPPYCQAQGRDCAYYGVRATRAAEDGRQYAWLKQVRCTLQIDSFHMRPKIRK